MRAVRASDADLADRVGLEQARPVQLHLPFETVDAAALGYRDPGVRAN
jgi:hypothetical protein